MQFNLGCNCLCEGVVPPDIPETLFVTTWRLNQQLTTLWKGDYGIDGSRTTGTLTNGIAEDSNGNFWVVGETTISGVLASHTAEILSGIDGSDVGLSILHAQTVSPIQLHDVLIDASDNLYVGGNEDIFPSGAGGFTIKKFDSLQTLLWQKNDIEVFVLDIDFDSNGNIFAAGVSNVGGFSTGQVARYQPDGTLDFLLSLGTSTTGLVATHGTNFFVGYTFGFTAGDFQLQKYDQDQILLWSRTGFTFINNLNQLVVDSNGDLYAITGNLGLPGQVYKFDGATGATIDGWPRTHNLGSTSGIGRGYMAIDRFGDLYVTGPFPLETTPGSGKFFNVEKYTSEMVKIRDNLGQEDAEISFGRIIIDSTDAPVMTTRRYNNG